MSPNSVLELTRRGATFRYRLGHGEALLPGPCGAPHRRTRRGRHSRPLAHRVGPARTGGARRAAGQPQRPAGLRGHRGVYAEALAGIGGARRLLDELIGEVVALGMKTRGGLTWDDVARALELPPDLAQQWYG